MAQSLRTLVVHDSAGRIHSLVVSSADAPLLTPALEAGEQCSIVDGVNVSLDASDAELHEQLSGIAERFTVEQSEPDQPPSARLAPKTQ